MAMGQAVINCGLGIADRGVPEGRGHGRRWHNHLPGWIEGALHAWALEEEHVRLRPIYRKTLQAVADACPPPDEAGNLVGAWGTRRLAQLAGVSVRTFWRHLRALEPAGYIVIIARLASADARDGANIYAIPGKLGELDGHKRRRRVMQMLQDGRGRWVPQFIAPGGQGTLFLTHPTDKMSRTPLTKCHGPPCQNVTQSPYGISDGNHHGGDGVLRPVGKRRAKIRNVRPQDLADTGLLLELYTDSVARGLIDGSEAGRLRFVGAAERALRIAEARDRCAVFAGIVNRGQWLFVSQGDEDAASERIKRHLYGEDDVDPEPEGDTTLSTLSTSGRQPTAARELPGRTEASPGRANCYAERMAKRLRGMGKGDER